MIELLVERLRAARLDPDPAELAEALWLALHMRRTEAAAPSAVPAPPAPPGPDAPSMPATTTELAPELAAEPPRESAPAHEPPRAPLLARAGRPVTGGGGVGGLPFRSPAAVALPGALDLARAMRPLMRRVPDPQRPMLDEAATVQAVAEADLRVWAAVLRPGRARWLSVELVLDEGASMVIWQRAAAELRRLLERLGAFRDLRIWGFDTSEPAHATLFAHGDPARRPRSPEELVDPAGRRLVLVLSDCVSPAWREGGALPALRCWSAAGPAALLQVLPERLWAGTALGEALPARLRATAPGLPSARLSAELPIWGGELPPGTVILPVLTLEPEAAAAWAQLLAGGGAWAPGLALLPERPEAVAEAPETLTADERLARFRAVASPPARRLAGYLAAAPLTLPVMRLVQQVMLPDTRQTHLAEVFLGGLLRRVGAPAAGEDPETVRYDFVEPRLRGLLLDGVPVPDSVTVLRSVADEVRRSLSHAVERGAGQALDFDAILADPDGALELPATEEAAPFAEVTALVLRRLGARYERAAARLEQQYGLPSPAQRRAQRKAERSSLVEPVVPPEEAEVPKLFLDLQGDIWLGEQRLEQRLPKLRQRCLEYLWANRHRRVSSRELVEEVYGDDPNLESRADPVASLRKLIRNLRQNLEPERANSHTYIDDVLGYGYVLRNFRQDTAREPDNFLPPELKMLQHALDVDDIPAALRLIANLAGRGSTLRIQVALIIIRWAERRRAPDERVTRVCLGAVDSLRWYTDMDALFGSSSELANDADVHFRSLSELAEHFAPTTIGRYAVQRVEAAGAVTVDYRVRDEGGSRFFARVVNAEHTRDPVRTAQAAEELRRTQGLAAADIVTVVEAGVIDGRLVIVDDTPDWLTLEMALAGSKPLSWLETVSVVRDVAFALHNAHTAGIVHRGLAPSAIRLNRARTIRPELGSRRTRLSGHHAVVSGFRLALAAARAAGSSHERDDSLVIGSSPAYTAPEVWERDADEPPVDVYALACIAYEAATGRRLFDAAMPTQLLRAHIDGPVFPERWPDGVAPGFGELLRRALSRDPAARPTSLEFADAIWALFIAAAQPTQPEPSSPPLPDDAIDAEFNQLAEWISEQRADVNLRVGNRFTATIVASTQFGYDIEVPEFANQPLQAELEPGSRRFVTGQRVELLTTAIQATPGLTHVTMRPVNASLTERAGDWLRSLGRSTRDPPFELGSRLHPSQGPGVVYQGQLWLPRQKAPRTVALKLYGRRFGANTEDPTLLRAEAQILASLQLQGIPRFVSYGEGNDYAYLAMELVQGPTLDSVLGGAGSAQPPQSWERILQIVTSLSQTLGALHAAGFVHREVIPENVRLVDQGSVLLDFGRADRIDEQWSADLPLYGLTPLVGSAESGDTSQLPKFIATYSGVYSRMLPWVDIAALAWLTFQLFTGERAQEYVLSSMIDATHNASRARRAGGESLGEQVAERLVGVLLRALNRDHSARFRDAPAFAAALAAIDDAPPSPASRDLATVERRSRQARPAKPPELLDEGLPVPADDDFLASLLAVDLPQAEPEPAAEREATLAPGRQFGKYLLLNEIGLGAFAPVYRARHIVLGGEVALKLLPPNLRKDQDGIERFFREGRNLVALNHPAIAKIYEIGEASEQFYIATQRVGASLARRLEDHGPLPWATALALLDPMCEGLDYAHNRGVAHCNLNPANVHFAEDGRPLLSDFGVDALIAGLNPQAEAIIGVPSYIAPEVWEGNHLGSAADHYALACIFYEMLTGAQLFAGSSALQVARAHLQGPRFPEQWPVGVPSGVEAVLRHALALRPEERFPTAEAFYTALDQLEHIIQQVAINRAIEEAKALVQQGDFGGARAVIQGIPEGNAELKERLREQIDEVEQQAREREALNTLIETTLEQAKAALSRGHFADARSSVQLLPNQPASVQELKASLLSQIVEIEAQWAASQREVDRLTRKLNGKNVNWEGVRRLAQERDIDPANPITYAQLLAAIDAQI